MNTVLAILRGIRPKQTDYSQASVLNLWPLLDLGWDADPERRPTMTEFLRRLKELVPPKLPPRQGSYESTLSDSSSSATTGSRSISRQVSKSALPTPESAPTAEQPWSVRCMLLLKDPARAKDNIAEFGSQEVFLCIPWQGL